MADKKRVSNDDKKIGAKIRLLRQISGTTQAKLARHLDISHQQLQKYEMGINKVSASKLIRISKILNISIYMFFDNSKLAEELENNSINFDKSALRLMKLYTNIESENLRKLLIFSANSYVNEYKKT